MDKIKVGVSVGKNEVAILRHIISQILNQTVCKVRFMKADGTERVMKCTLRQDLIPDEHKPKSDPENPRKVSEDIIPVYELDKEKAGWKSFRVDSLKSVSIIK